MDWTTLHEKLHPTPTNPWVLASVKALSATDEVLGSIDGGGVGLTMPVGVPIDVGGTVTAIEVAFAGAGGSTVVLPTPRVVRAGYTLSIEV